MWEKVTALTVSYFVTIFPGFSGYDAKKTQQTY